VRAEAVVNPITNTNTNTNTNTDTNTNANTVSWRAELLRNDEDWIARAHALFHTHSHVHTPTQTPLVMKEVFFRGGYCETPVFMYEDIVTNTTSVNERFVCSGMILMY